MPTSRPPSRVEAKLGPLSTTQLLLAVWWKSPCGRWPMSCLHWNKRIADVSFFIFSAVLAKQDDSTTTCASSWNVYSILKRGESLWRFSKVWWFFTVTDMYWKGEHTGYLYGFIRLGFSSRWWFQIFLFWPRKLGKWSNLTSIFFKGVGSTTNQFCLSCCVLSCLISKKRMHWRLGDYPCLTSILTGS